MTMIAQHTAVSGLGQTLTLQGNAAAVARLLASRLSPRDWVASCEPAVPSLDGDQAS